MAKVSLKALATISRETWSPSKSTHSYVWHYSIPNFDTGLAKLESISSIMSNKFLITEPCVLISKLNPKTPRVWLIEKLQGELSVCSTEFIVLTPKSQDDLRFLYFLLKSNEVKQRLSEIATGTSNSHQRVRPEDILSLEVECVESILERQKCSKILMSLESHISLNIEMSKTLEDIAQTIFKSWFIDFDPVKLKMTGERPVGMDDATAALFPDSMENSELGMVPTGWKVHKLGDVCRTAIGGLWGKDSESADSPSPYRCIRGVDMDDLKHIGFAPRTPLRWDKVRNHERRAMNGLSILIAGSGAGPVGKSLLWDESMSELFDGPVIYSNFVKRFECESRAIASFVSSVLSQMYSSGEIFVFVNGTSVPNLQDAELLNTKKIVLPSEGVLQKFDSLIRLNSNLKFNGSNRTLAEIRDSLLPQLISGELRLPEEMLAS